jgi:hypothetical protein
MNLLKCYGEYMFYLTVDLTMTVIFLLIVSVTFYGIWKTLEWISRKKNE